MPTQSRRVVSGEIQRSLGKRFQGAAARVERRGCRGAWGEEGVAGNNKLVEMKQCVCGLMSQI